MVGELQRNNDHNARLAKEVTHLREEIRETAKDIEAIEKFIMKAGKDRLR